MARRPFNHDDAAAMAANLKRLREAAGTPPHTDIHLFLVIHCGLTITEETVRKYHVGEVDPHTAPVEVLAGLARFYNVGLSDISEVALNRARNTSDLLERSLRCSTASPLAA